MQTLCSTALSVMLNKDGWKLDLVKYWLLQMQVMLPH